MNDGPSFKIENDQSIEITHGHGAGKSRKIIRYDPLTNTVTVGRNWEIYTGKFPLFNLYLPLRQRIYCTVWPPSVRVAIGRGMMFVACVAMKKRAWTKDEITISAHMAYDLLDASNPGPDDLREIGCAVAVWIGWAI